MDTCTMPNGQPRFFFPMHLRNNRVHGCTKHEIGHDIYQMAI